MPIRYQKLPQQVYDHLLGKMLSGEMPSGFSLNEAALAQQIGVSRTPVREALLRLAANGFIEICSNRRAMVRGFTAEQVSQIYQIREALEGMAAELACGRFYQADFTRLDKLARAVDQCDAAAYCRACHRFDRELHRLVAERSGNEALAHEIVRFHGLVQLVRDHVGNRDGGLARAHREHLQIVAALNRGDAARARAAMVEHIRSARNLAVTFLTESSRNEATTLAAN